MDLDAGEPEALDALETELLDPLPGEKEECVELHGRKLFRSHDSLRVMKHRLPAAQQKKTKSVRLAARVGVEIVGEAKKVRAVAAAPQTQTQKQVVSKGTMGPTRRVTREK